jgi:ferritin-like metal-binding protein YciE
MARASSNTQLRQAFEEHLRQTSEQVSRLEEIFNQLQEKPAGRKCLGMDGIIKEGAEIMREAYSEELMDAAIIGAAQKAEHYEVAGYGTAKALAHLLGYDEHVSLLDATLKEEKETDQKLTQLSAAVNARAEQSGKGKPAPAYETKRAA